MRVTCPNCDRPYRERNFVPGAARKCPHCEEIVFLPMDQVPEAYLVPLEGEGAGNRIPLAARMVIGRAHECEIHVLDNTLSRQHAEICLAQGNFVITDLESRNRVMVNGVTMAEAQLANGDVIRLGNRSFRFEMLGRAARPAAWTPEVKTRLGATSGENHETSSTVRMSPQESAALLATLFNQQGTAALAPQQRTQQQPALPEPVPIRVLPDPVPEPHAPLSPPPHAAALPDPTRTHATVLCAELYGITELALSPEPRRAIEIINRYLGVLVDVSHRHGAFVDQVNGESVQAFWTAPAEGPEGPLMAVQCALDIHQALAELNGTLAGEGLFPVQVAIGIHSGQAVAGQLVAGSHCEYAVVGETVHLAGRLRACARPGEILLTQATYALLNGVAKTMLLPYLELPGWSGHGHIYMLQGLYLTSQRSDG